MYRLSEATRNELIAKSKSSANGGKQRFARRNKSAVANSVKEFNSINMNELFKENILTVNIKVRGETDNYIIKIKFGGLLDILHENIKRTGSEELDLRVVIRSLIQCFNSDNVYIGCSCPDFHYRFGYYATLNDYTSLSPENRPSDITNPNDDKGSACKHILLVLSNTSWLIKIASVIKNYINYIKIHYEKAYADIIYPALYKKQYEEPVQLSIDDSDELETDEKTIDTANTSAVERTRFKKGNQEGVRFAPKELDDDELALLDEN